ncbi:MAG: PEGA domain-containing protein, partial [Spirochaetaceae bacterium]|nr:PEGA domain-containing protein [Spirochaetaceae bacterium]
HAESALASAAALLPRLIRDELAGVELHELTDAEKTLLAGDLLDKKELQSYSTLNDLYSGRDELLFDLNADPSSRNDRDIRIREEHAALTHWLNYPPHLVAAPDDIPVKYPVPPEGGDIWDTEGASPETFRRSAGLDVLITGSIVRVGDYFGISISAFGPAGEEVLWEGAGSESEFEEISIEAGAAARRVILGRPWSSLTVQSDPSDAVISYNGRSVGVGFWSDSTLYPGEVLLEITAAGHAPQIIHEVLAPSGIRVIDVILEETVQPQILVRTIPTGASVRLGNIWIGRAPLSVNLPDRVMSITVEKEGYRTRTIPLYPDAERLTIPLDYILVDPAVELATARKRMYNSIAWFSFSLAPTIILMGVSQNYVNMFFAARDAGNVSEQEFAYNAYNLTYGLMWGSVAINVGLLINVFFKLSRFLKAAEELSD